jgi:hypothetical protein
MATPKKVTKPVIIKISIPKEFANLMDKELSRIHELLLKNPENTWAQESLYKFWDKLDSLLLPAKNMKSEFDNEVDLESEDDIAVA